MLMGIGSVDIWGHPAGNILYSLHANVYAKSVTEAGGLEDMFPGESPVVSLLY